MFHPDDIVHDSISKDQFPHLSMWYDAIFLILNVPCPHVGMKKQHVCQEVINIVEVFDFLCKRRSSVYLCRYFSFN